MSLVHRDQPSPARRDFLKCAGAALVAMAPMAAWARASACRSLSFVHTHTGETLDTGRVRFW